VNLGLFCIINLTLESLIHQHFVSAVKSNILNYSYVHVHLQAFGRIQVTKVLMVWISQFYEIWLGCGGTDSACGIFPKVTKWQ
jgi:hypothetical protein